MPWDTSKVSIAQDFLSALEKSGEDEVRSALARGDAWVTYENRSAIAMDWLKRKEDARKADSDSAARLANTSARSQDFRYRMWAIMATIAIAMLAAQSQILSLINFLIGNP